MSKIIVTVATVAVALAAGQTAGALRYTLTSTATGARAAQIDSQDASVEFADVTPGEYTVSVGRLDGAGDVIGALVVGAITVPEVTPETVDVPVSITLALG